MASLPGSRSTPRDDEWGLNCLNHPDVLAVVRICTESDSFGSEYENYCQECMDQPMPEDEEVEEECCPECGLMNGPIYPYRDPDEGSHGRVYYQCKVCQTTRADILREEMDMEDDDDYDPFDYIFDDMEDDGMDVMEEEESERDYVIRIFRRMIVEAKQIADNLAIHAEFDSYFGWTPNPPGRKEVMVNQILKSVIEFPTTVEAENLGLSASDILQTKNVPMFYHSSDSEELGAICYFTMPDDKYHIFAFKRFGYVEGHELDANSDDLNGSVLLMWAPGVYEYRFDPVRDKIKTQTNLYSSYAFLKRVLALSEEPHV